ncbi:MAG: chemotaxis protein, partial [Caulobacter sp.]|nr:chemotaxis protein [Caulobacter sp.]
QDGSGTLVAFHATPGYETYRGLGWYGCLVQTAEAEKVSATFRAGVKAA